MTSRFHSPLASTVALGICLLSLPYACDDGGTKKKDDVIITSIGGTSSQTMPQTTPTSGASGTSTQDADGGTSATTTLPDIDCESDIACKASGLLCDTNAGKCVQCLQSADCSDGSSCVAGLCGGETGCTTNDDCADSESGKTCDVQRGRCVACVTSEDCAEPDSNECINNECVAITPCINSLGCTTESAPICDTVLSPSRCVQCTTNADCVAQDEGNTCENSHCVISCESNDDCTDGKKCNTSGSSPFCAECAEHSDCGEGKFCSKGTCVADICKAGVDQACINGGVATCNDDGDGFGAPEACPSEQSCTVSNSRASCGSGGGTTNPNSGCADDPGSIDPCKEIPKFSGTQKVDGNSDDFCNVPSFELSFANAKGVNNNKITSGSTSDYTQRAIAKIAWSTDAIHAYIKVIEKPVRSNSSVDKIWDGDSIELMITPNGSGSGPTVDDPKALHIIANNALVVTVKSTKESGTHTQLSDSNQVWTGYTDDGFAVELNIPWPDSTKPSAGTAVRFDMTMNVDTESVDPTVWGRDAQAVFAMTTLTGESTCAATPATPFCDEALWCPTKLK